jgi:hypothetical protein
MSNNELNIYNYFDNIVYVYNVYPEINKEENLKKNFVL